MYPPTRLKLGLVTRPFTRPPGCLPARIPASRQKLALLTRPFTRPPAQS